MKRYRTPSDSLNVLDLFCGCGGLSLGFIKKGFQIIAALDIDPVAIYTYRLNHPEIPQERIIQCDLVSFPPEDLISIIGKTRVDVILGGPPCQGFSSVRQVDGSNSGKRIIDDPRRELYQEYFRYINFFHPVFFVLENVLGLKSMNKGYWWNKIRQTARYLGYRICPIVVDASDFGIPQYRRRLLVIGTREDYPHPFHKSCLIPTHHEKKVSLWEAIGDLPPLEAGEGKDSTEYDLHLRKEHIARYGEAFLFEVLEINRALKLTHHVARAHSQRDLRDFSRLREGEHSGEAIRRGVPLEFPYKREIFKDRYKRQSRNLPCSTILAHLAKDGLMFIHPTQIRSLTVREAARIQTFPDWFLFPSSRTHAYRLIGNAVPPLLGLALAQAIKGLLQKKKKTRVSYIPENITQAISDLSFAIEAIREKQLGKLSKSQILRAWNSCFFLMPGLHPDETLDHGSETETFPMQDLKGFGVLANDLSTYYVRSGWPVVLEPLAVEVMRRANNGLISDENLYCYEACLKGMTAKE